MTTLETDCQRCCEDGSLCKDCPLIGMSLLTEEQCARLGVDMVRAATDGRWARDHANLVDAHRNSVYTLLHPIRFGGHGA